MRSYWQDINVFGDGEEYGPVSPEQLAQLDRKLTPAEQKAVDDWQASQSDAALAAERKKGGPQSATVSVTPKGAVIERPKSTPVAKTVIQIPWWAYPLAAAGVFVVGLGIYKAVKR